MKAITCPKYGSSDVHQFPDVVKPVPLEDEVLILAVNGYHPISGYLRALKLGGSFVHSISTGCSIVVSKSDLRTIIVSGVTVPPTILSPGGQSKNLIGNLAAF